MRGVLLLLVTLTTSVASAQDGTSQAGSPPSSKGDASGDGYAEEDYESREEDDRETDPSGMTRAKTDNI